MLIALKIKIFNKISPNEWKNFKIWSYFASSEQTDTFEVV